MTFYMKCKSLKWKMYDFDTKIHFLKKIYNFNLNKEWFWYEHVCFFRFYIQNDIFLIRKCMIWYNNIWIGYGDVWFWKKHMWFRCETVWFRYEHWWFWYEINKFIMKVYDFHIQNIRCWYENVWYWNENWMTLIWKIWSLYD